MPRWTARNSRDRDLDDEIVHDLELEIDELVRAGMSREKAERASRRDFGNVLYIKEDIRGRWTRTWLERLAQDLRYAARTLRRDFAFSLTALLSLVLGIGVATALFSVGYAILIAPFPYAKPGEIWNVSQGAAFHVSDYLEIGQLPACSEVMAESPVDVLRTGSGVFETLRVMQLSGNSFSFLGAQPLLGRTIRPTDIHADGTAEPVAVLSYEAWQRWFGGDAGAIGKTLLLNRQPRTVVGVTAPRFGWWTDVWLPLPLDRYDRAVTLKLRLRGGVPQEAAEGQLRALLTPNATLEKPHWDRAGHGLETAMKWLMLVGSLLLLISCACVANLQLARVTVRSREIAVRAALGAGPLRLVRQLLTESVALSLAGGALGVLLALPLMPVIAALLPDLRSVRPDEVRISLSGTVVLFSVGISLAAGILSGLAPALQCARLSLPEALKDAAGASGGRQAGGNLLAGLVVVEVALAVILLFGAIVTAREYATVRERGRGFQTVRVLKSGFSLPPKFYPGYAGRMEFARSLLERLQKLPGVESAALGSPPGLQSGASIAGQPESAPRLVSVTTVSRGFAGTLGIPLRAGRDLEQQEIDRAVPVALVNERAARLLWPTGANPIGARLRLGILANPHVLLPMAAGATPEVTIVGILADSRMDDHLGIAGGPLIFLPDTLVALSSRTIFVRTVGLPILLWDAVQREIRSLDRDQAAGSPWVVEGDLNWNENRAGARFDMALFGLVGLIGLALAAAGIYCVLSYTVTRRTHEVGIRMALGATRGQVLRPVLLMGARLIAMGLALGLPGTFAISSMVEGDVPKAGAWSVAAIMLALVPVALLACYAPARRAICSDPSVALRHD